MRDGKDTRMADILIRTGTLRVPFSANYRIAIENLVADRPLFEGQKAAVYVPDPFLPEWLTIRIAD